MQSTIMWDGFAVCSSKNEEWHDGCDDMLYLVLLVWMTFTDRITDVQLLFVFSTDSRFKLLGSTVLYIPLEALQHRPEEAVTNKSLVQRLESKTVVMCVWVLVCVNGCVRAWIISDGVDCEEWTVWKVRKTPFAGNYIYHDSPWLESVNVIYTVTTAEGQK